MVKILLSTSAAGGFNTEKAFRIARDLGTGVELMPYNPKMLAKILSPVFGAVNEDYVIKQGNPKRISSYSNHYGVEVEGIHMPFWWHTKPLREVIESERDFSEKIYSFAWSQAIRSGSLDSMAVRLSREFPQAYLLSHPDVFRQMPEKDRVAFAGRDIYFENERNKGSSFFSDGIQDSGKNDIETIVNEIFPAARDSGIIPHLMFDSRHAQLDMKKGYMKTEKLSNLWERYKPEGLHFSFKSPQKGGFPNLPDVDTWDDFKESLKEYPPKYVVLEIGPGKEDDLKAAKEIIDKTFP